jgi:hypothetical protein
LPPSWADCLKIWNLNLLEPAGPIKTCNGIALPFTLHNLLFSYQDGVALSRLIYLDLTEGLNDKTSLYTLLSSLLLLLVIGRNKAKNASHDNWLWQTNPVMYVKAEDYP